MKYVVMAVHDVQAAAYGRPIFVGTVSLGARSFTDEVNRCDLNNQMFQHPDDFALYDLGTFDDSDGSFSLHASPVLVVKAVTVKA